MALVTHFLFSYFFTVLVFFRKFSASKVLVYIATVVTLNLKGGKGRTSTHIRPSVDNFTHIHMHSYWWRHDTLVIAN